MTPCERPSPARMRWTGPAGSGPFSTLSAARDRPQSKRSSGFDSMTSCLTAVQFSKPERACRRGRSGHRASRTARFALGRNSLSSTKKHVEKSSCISVGERGSRGYGCAAGRTRRAIGTPRSWPAVVVGSRPCERQTGRKLSDAWQGSGDDSGNWHATRTSAGYSLNSGTRAIQSGPGRYESG